MAEDCVVWWADLSYQRPWHVSLLSGPELARRGRLRRADDVARFTVAAALLRLSAAAVLDTEPALVEVDRTCPTCSEAHGRPTLPGSNVHVSVTHSGDLVAVAVTEVGPVGVDVERVVDLDGVDLARLVLGPGEEATDTQGFFVYWTRKESVVKATGDGLRVPLTDVVVSRPTEPPRLLAYPGRPGLAATMADLDAGAGYTAAVSVLTGKPVTVRGRDARALLVGTG